MTALAISATLVVNVCFWQNFSMPALTPFLSMLKAGYSSLYYRGESNIYDCLLVSYDLAHPADGTFGIIPITKKKYYARIFSKPFMTNQSGQYKGTPKRTFSNGAFVGGYSDHYPTYIVIKK